LGNRCARTKRRSGWRFRGTATRGQWRITEASPAVPAAALADAMAFARRLSVDRRLLVHGAQERRALDSAAAFYAPGDDEFKDDED
jgi:hypothetical protein